MKLFKKIYIIRIAVAVVIVILAFIIYFLLMYSKRAPNQNEISAEKTWTLACVSVKDNAVRLEVDSYGTVRSAKYITVSSLIKGEIDYELDGLRNGKIVQKGQVIFRINDIDYKNQLSKINSKMLQLKTQIENKKLLIDNEEQLYKSAVLQYKLDRKQVERSRRLVDTRVVSPQKFEDVELNSEEYREHLINAKNKFYSDKIMLEDLEAKLKTVEVSKKIAEINIERCIIRSPIKGRIDNLKHELGEYVMTGSPLFDVADDSNLEIPISVSIDAAANIFRFSSDNYDYNHWFNFAKNMPVKVVWSSSNMKSIWQGQVIGIERYDKDTRTIILLIKTIKEISKGNNYIPLVEGMFCKVSLFGRKVENAMRIPLSALQLDGCIYTVENSRLSRHNAKVIQYGNSTAVISVKNINPDVSLVVQKLPQAIIVGARVKAIKPLVMGE